MNKYLPLIVVLALSSCSTTPIVDSRGKSSANLKGDMNRYHDDLFTCKSLVEEETNFLLEQGKIKVAESMREDLEESFSKARYDENGKLDLDHWKRNNTKENIFSLDNP